MNDRMEEFHTLLYKENDIKTHNKRIAREQVLLTGVLIVLIGYVFEILEWPFVTPIFFIGVCMVTIGRFLISGKDVTVGHSPLGLRLTRDAIYLGQTRIEMPDKSLLEIIVMAHEGEPRWASGGIYHAYNGTENIMRLRRGESIVEWRFVLGSKEHKEKLLNFCQRNGYTNIDYSPSWSERVEQFISKHI